MPINFRLWAAGAKAKQPREEPKAVLPADEPEFKRPRMEIAKRDFKRLLTSGAQFERSASPVSDPDDGDLLIVECGPSGDLVVVPEDDGVFVADQPPLRPQQNALASANSNSPSESEDSEFEKNLQEACRQSLAVLGRRSPRRS